MWAVCLYKIKQITVKTANILFYGVLTATGNIFPLKKR